MKPIFSLLLACSLLIGNDYWQKAIDFFEKQKNIIQLPEDLAKLYDEILSNAKQNPSGKKYTTIFALTSFSLDEKSDFNKNFERETKLLESRGVEFQSAYVLRGFPFKEDIPKFFFKMAGLKQDPRNILTIIQQRAKDEGLSEKEYMEYMASKEGMDIKSYAKKLYFDEIGEPKPMKTSLKILPRLFKSYNITQAPAYIIGECPKLDTDFDLDECVFDAYSLGDVGLETFLKYTSMKHKKYDDLYFKMIGGVK